MLSIILNSYRNVRTLRGDIKTTNWNSYDYDYWILSNSLLVDIEIEKKKQKHYFSDDKLLKGYEKKYDLDPDIVVGYTDGSKKENAILTGVGIVFEDSDESYYMSLDPRFSVFLAELVAIEKALSLLEDRKEARDILLLTDSKSACEGLLNNKLTGYVNRIMIRIKERIWKISNAAKIIRGVGSKIVIAWIPGHYNIKGNEIADSLAKEATGEIYDTRIEIVSEDWKKVLKMIC